MFTIAGGILLAVFILATLGFWLRAAVVLFGLGCGLVSLVYGVGAVAFIITTKGDATTVLACFAISLVTGALCALVFKLRGSPDDRLYRELTRQEPTL